MPVSSRARQILGSRSMLFVEDDADTRELFREYFARIFAHCDVAADGQRATALLRESHYAVLVVDINLPFRDGISLIKELRASDSQVRILIASAHADQHYLLDAVELDVTRFLVKPFMRQDLDAALERAAEQIEERLQLPLALADEWHYDTATRTLLFRGEAVRLTRMELALFDLLVRHAGRVVDYALIEQQIYDDRPMTSDALKSLVKELRRKLPPGWVENRPGCGYQLGSSALGSPG